MSQTETRPGDTQNRAGWVALATAPILFGLMSLILGQDANWDLTNYHLYNAYAFLNDRLQLDRAPAGIQSYFNPLIDLPYYWLITNLPARLVSFLMGCFHGITFWLLFGITGCFSGIAHRHHRVVVSAVGCLSPLFLSELGNTMGDLTTAPFLLGALWILLSAATPKIQSNRLAVNLFFAGLLVGLAVGLKLSNGPFAVGLGFAVTSLPAKSLSKRVRALAIASAGLTLGFVLTGAYWLFVIWSEFRNPLFPQFNRWFGADLALPVSIVDTRFMVHGAWDALLLPYTAVFDYMRVTELNLILFLWPTVYTLIIALLSRVAFCLCKGGNKFSIRSAHTDRGLVIFCFILVTYILWVALFGIARYVLALEMLLPLCTLLLLRQLFPYRYYKITCALLVIAVLATASRPNGWGHAKYADANFFVQDLGIAYPERATVIVGDIPVAWVIPFLSPAISYVGIGNGFPASKAYLIEARQRMLSRGGTVHMLVRSSDDALVYHLTDVRFQSDLQNVGIRVLLDSCRVRPARIGAKEIGYRLCDVEFQR